MPGKSLPAKFAPPRLDTIFPRERLNAVLDAALARPIVWLAGAPGAGKTTLVAGWLKTRKRRALWYQLDASDADPAAFFHYLGIAVGNFTLRKPVALPQLTPEHLPSLAAYARRYFEIFSVSLDQQTVLVIDNYHEVVPDSPLHALLAEVFASLPAHVNVIAISRAEPPAAFARLRINRNIALIGADQFKLSADEALGFAQSLGHTQSLEFVVHLHEKVAGWAAGLVLLLERAQNIPDSTTHADAVDSSVDQQILFDYFAVEILSHSTSDTRDVLLKTALLSRFTAASARTLTGVARSQDILDDLVRRHYFTVRRPASTGDIYEYHPLFRAFLVSQARNHYSSKEFNDTQHKVAALLEAQGDVETAVCRYLDLRAWDKAVGLILTRAPMLLQQGRHGTVREWIAALPVEHSDADPRLKLLLAAATQLIDLVAARQHYSEAFEAFKERDDASGAYSAWSGAVETFVYRWSDFTALTYWIEQLSALRIRHPKYPATVEARVVAGMVSALTWRNPCYEVMRPWVERAEALLLDPHIALTLRLALANHLIFYRVWWLGDLASAVHILSIIKPLLRNMSAEPLPILQWHVMESTYLAGINAHDECLRTVARGLHLARDSGIHFLDAVLNGKGVYASLFAGDVAGAQEYLKRTSASLAPDAYLEIAHYHHQATWIALCRGDFDEAREHIRTCARFAARSDTPLATIWVKHTLPHVLVESAAYLEAVQHLDEVLRSIDTIQGNAVKFHCLLSRAYVLLRAGDPAGAVASLVQALSLGKQKGYISPPWIGWRLEVMSELCALALIHKIETEYVCTMIRERGLLPPTRMEVPESWPFPVKVYTLGHFSLTVHDTQIQTSGNAARKPLTLFKALLAFGGRNVSQQKLIHALWPDSDGDAGRKAFEIALHRLRKLFGTDLPFILKNGELSLDARLCWVDCWALERLLSKLDTAASALEVDTLLEPVLNLYQGAFLGCDEELAAALPLREKLRSRLLRSALRVAERCESQEYTAQAERIYLRLLEIEPVVEESYYRLIRLYERQGRHADALACFRRCERMLNKMLGVVPSFMMDHPGGVTDTASTAPYSRHLPKRPH